MVKDKSTADERQKSNIYYPFASYSDYVSYIVIGAMDINEMLKDIPPNMIADFWLINSEFRTRFKKLVSSACFAHYETHLNNLLPWCTFDIAKYAQRFKERNDEIVEKIKNRQKGIYD